jgi:predicted aspartyl protease
MADMGMVHVDVEVSRDGATWESLRCLVDSGAHYSVLPDAVWRRLGLAALRTMDFVLADGTVVRRNIANAFFQYRGIVAPSPVILGEPNDAPLLGTITLENMGLVLNPFERTLRPMRMKLAALMPSPA